MRALDKIPTRFPVLDIVPTSTSGWARIGSVWHLPEALRSLGVDLGDALEAAGVRPEIFDDRENTIAYPALASLLRESERLANCDHIGLLLGQRSGLADFGLAGRVALCSETAGEGLHNLVGYFQLHSTASIISVITAGGFTRLVYSVAELGITDTRILQLGAMTIALNLLRELCGPAFRPTVVTFACRSPSDPKPVHQFFRAPLRFDSDESAIVFEQRWLDRQLPPVDPLVRRQVEAEARARQASILARLPDTVRLMLRRQLQVGDCSMDSIAALFGMHRRTLDRHLQRHGIRYGELVESVKSDVARQLLRDTDLQVQKVAESLQFSSAANFATAFRRWTGVTPSEYRRRAR